MRISKYFLALTLMCCGSMLAASAQQAEASEKHSVKLEPFFNNWYVQAGLDMSLQNPYDTDFSKVFPNGKTFGVDAFLGKWFTPALGLRLGLNWENGIRLFENHHANWLAPLYQPGVNMDKGGYLCIQGDVMLDIHNLIWGYDPERKWNFQVFLRGGGLYNFGVSKGSPLLGAGVSSTYRINERWGVYGDIAYQGVSSGHGGMATGSGSGSNGFFDIVLGVQYKLGHQGFTKAVTPLEGVTHRFLDDWFVRVGMDMALHCPYGKDFSEVFPKGKVFGLDAAVGKWFSPEIALRLHLDWGNGLKFLSSDRVEWVSPGLEGGKNVDKGGYVLATLDVPVSFTNIFLGYDPDRKLNFMGFPRAGLISNRAIKSLSPSIGGGLGVTYRLDKRLSLYGEAAMQTTTSEFYEGVAGTGMLVPTGYNCIFTFEAGIQIDL